MPPFSHWIAVALGGALGSVARAAVGYWMPRPHATALPWATLAVNIVGSFVLGWFLRSAVAGVGAERLRAFVAIGICGGFTTFSTFAFEVATLLQEGATGRAAVYVATSVLLSITAVFAGFAAAGG